jgi:hypothetical protein
MPVSQALDFHLHFYFKHSYSFCSIIVIADLVQLCTKSVTTNMEQREYILLVNIFTVKENYTSLLTLPKFDILSKARISKFLFIFFSEIRLQHMLGMNMMGPQQRSGSTLPSPGGYNSKPPICTGNSKDKVRT